MSPRPRRPDAQARRALEALHRPLRLAARDGFRELDRTPNLGAALARAAGALVAALPESDPQRGIFEAYADELDGFDLRSRRERAQLVARGLRLCASSDRGAAASPRRPLKGREDSGPDPAPGTAGTPLTGLRGVGQRVAERLAARGVGSAEDLLYLLPLEYLDRRERVPLSALEEGQLATTRGVVVKVGAPFSRRRRMLEVKLADAEGEAARLTCVWFKAFPGLAERFQPGQPITVSGVVRRYRGELQIVHPDLLEEGAHGGIRRRYPVLEGVAPRVLERLCTEACQRFADAVDDGVPHEVADELGLPGQAQALKVLHLCGHEPTAEELDRLRRGEHEAQRRLVFDELFSLQLAVALRRAAWGTRRATPAALSADAAARLRACLPFGLTGAQERVVSEILHDMGRDRPMHRLLQGDVGSGKTAVALFAACAAMDSGLQAAIMAPTEILARQHFQTLEPWIRQLGWRAGLVTAATQRGVRESLLALADAGMIHLLVGTHALLSPRVSLPNLGLAVVDEQHRFGVLQRVRLRERPPDQPLPHLLLMTATPIPRSMALALYGDLDLSVLDEKPPGRQPPTTTVYLGEQRSRAYEVVGQQLRQGAQVFVVCPLVEQSEKLDVSDAVGTAERMQQLFDGFRVGLVHGRMSFQERAAVMDAFRRHEIDLLVATTVIEVGIDVPRATVMVVEHAERFGLAQLHQLRGRVGRGEEPSFCLLLSGASSETDAGQRLAVLARTHDGFEIAEADLQLRGPGEVFGTLQAGVPRFRFADLRAHMQLLSLAQRKAVELVERDPELALPENRAAARLMQRRWEGAGLVGEEAG